MAALAHPAFAWVVLGAFVLELLCAYPDKLFRWIGHPVSWMGTVITKADQRLNTCGKRQHADLVSGLLLVVGLGGALLVGAWQLAAFLNALSYGWLVELCLVATLLAGRSLYDHVKAVATALTEGGVEAGRIAVSFIVGRRVDDMDEPAIARAAVESLAESSSDGVIAPLFWALLAGLPGILVYKFVNTADSLIGHRTPRYEWFGKAAARLDDAMNWFPARLTGLLFVMCAGKGERRRACQIMWRDARAHLSPNAGWPEAAMAGALDLKLGGPRDYGTKREDGAWLGDGRSQLSGNDIERALALYRRALVVILVVILAGLLGAALLSVVGV